MPSPKPERELRRAVTQLSQYSIEDIEAIWAQLDPREQEQLRPMLAEASLALPYATALPGTQRSSSASAATDTAAAIAPSLAAYVGELPEAAAASALASLDDAQRESVLLALPTARREPLRASTSAVVLMPAARQALRAAVLAASHEAELRMPVAAPAEASPAPRRGFARFLRRSSPV